MNKNNETPVIHLKSHINDLRTTLLDLELEGDEFVHDMGKLEQDLEAPEKLVTDLKTLDESLDTLDEILDVCIVIPQIHIGGRELKKAIDMIKAPIHKARIVSSHCDPLMQDVLNAVTKLKTEIQKMDQDMEVKRDKVAKFNASVEQTMQCITNIPTQTSRGKQYGEMSQASAEVDKQVKNADKLVLLLDDSLDRINKEVEHIGDKLEFVEQISKPVEKIISEINLVTVPLQALKHALTHKISVPYERSTKFCRKWGIPYPCEWHVVHASFSVEQILSGLVGPAKPVEGMLKKEAKAFLAHRLKSLHFETKLSSIPGIDSLSAKLQDLFGHFMSLPKEIEELLKKAGKLELEIDAIHERRGEWQQMQDACK